MWGESSKKCELNCQCSGLITANFKINSGNNATKRKQESALSLNYKNMIHPQTLDFNQSPSPGSSKRRVLGEIQNIYTPPMSYNRTPMKRLLSPQTRSPINDPKLNSPLLGDQIRNTPLKTMASLDRDSPLSRGLKTPVCPSPHTPKFRTSPKEVGYSAVKELVEKPSPLAARSFKGSSRINRIFLERSQFKMSNKENEMVEDTFMKLDVEEETRDCPFSQKYPRVDWSTTKLDFTNLHSTLGADFKEAFVPQNTENFDDFDTLHDLEEEFESENFDTCTKYEIISTDSPNIISRGRETNTTKVNSRNFDFGAPLAENEPSTSFNRPNASATRMLNFGENDFEFTSPAVRKSLSVKKSLKFNESPAKTPLKHDSSDSSIGSMSSASSSKLRLFSTESTTSLESGFISELDEPLLDLDATISPKKCNPSFSDLFSGQIKDKIIGNNRKLLTRSISFNPDFKSRMSLISIKENAEEEKKTQKRQEGDDLEVASKRRKSNKSLEEKIQRPILQRAFSENNAFIMSALAKSVVESDLIGDFSLPFALPLTSGDHADLKSISCETLACLLRGNYQESICEFQVIDCRYPYEYDGGHILNALNLYTQSQILTLVNKPLRTPEPDKKRSILVFHCEFSLERGPKLSRFLRSSDREKNKENYPSLNYPEVYLLHEGYRSFYQKYPELCWPIGYTAMLDPEHRDSLRKHRSVPKPASSMHHRRNRLLL